MTRLRRALVERRRRRALAGEMTEILAFIDDLEHAEPCDTPSCMRARAHLRDIADRINPATG